MMGGSGGGTPVAAGGPARHIPVLGPRAIEYLAVRAGGIYIDATFGAGGYARLVQLDADFSHDPRRIPALVEASKDADVVIGSRYCAGGGVANWPLRRRALSRFANAYVGLITGIKVNDATGGFRCYTQRALRRLLEGRVAAEGYAFLVEAVYHAHREGLSIAEVPITFTDRREGQSKMSRKVIFESVFMPWRLRFAPKDGGGRTSKDEGCKVKDEVKADAG